MKFPFLGLSAILPAVTWVMAAESKKPNIVFILTDDQDLHHGSVDSQPAVQRLMAAQGTTFTNHYATVAVCCPSRVSLMRGQAAHNTNNTDIAAPGGGYPKFTASGEDDDYLPHWLGQAGYQTEYVGKLFNGNSLLNYAPGPKGWDHVDILLDPYINTHNTVVMSQNGARPTLYEGYQQTDVIRIKALDRLEKLVKKDDPFFLMIAPTAPHVENLRDPPTPPSRYIDTMANATLAKAPSFNPSDEFQSGKPAWLKTIPRLNDTQINEIEHLHQRRLESLRGVDDIIIDVVEKLEQAGQLDSTYIIFSTDQGYHLGTHRHAGKLLPYLQDTNIPLIVRGPGIPQGVVSKLPSTVTDFAPTLLDLAGLADEHWPLFFDGYSLREAWENPDATHIAKAREAINVEFWGTAFTEVKLWDDGTYAPSFPGYYLENDYKTLRIVGEKHAWLYSRWCTNDTELYNTKDDPHELVNLANSTDPYIQRVMSRLNALLLVTKSCEKETCRRPWSVIQPPNSSCRGPVLSLEDALRPAYDDFYNSFPLVTIHECLRLQLASNEGPFHPEEARFGLGLAHRKSPDNFEAEESEPVVRLPVNNPLGGGWDQRHATLDAMLREARALTDEELEQAESEGPR